MHRAQFYLWSLLHCCEHVDSGVLAALANQAASYLSVANKEQRRSDMESAVGIWAERTDLPDAATYLSNLRDEVRAERLVSA